MPPILAKFPLRQETWILMIENCLGKLMLWNFVINHKNLLILSPDFNMKYWFRKTHFTTFSSEMLQIGILGRESEK